MPVSRVVFAERVCTAHLAVAAVVIDHRSPTLSSFPFVKLFCGVTLPVKVVFGAFHSAVVPSGSSFSVLFTNATYAFASSQN